MKTSRSLGPSPLIVAATLGMFALGRSAEPALVDEPLRANATNVVDHRSSDRSAATAGCSVTLAFVGDDVDQAGDILRLDVTKAVDDLGRDLRPETQDSEPPPPSVLRLAYANPKTSTPLNGTILLRNPSRHATLIQVIEGTLKLFKPTKANGALIEITGVPDQPDVPLKNELLAKEGIELTYLSEARAREMLRDRRIDILPARSAGEEQLRLEMVAAEVSRRRALREATAATHEPPAPADESARASGPRALTRPTQLVFAVKDPQHRLVTLAWRDADGRPLPIFAGSTYDHGAIRTMFANDRLPPNAVLVAYVETDAAVTHRPFKVENIALP